MNGIGKLYNLFFFKLEYEGEFLNGKKHWKGKEYDYKSTGNLIFEGKFVNGHRKQSNLFMKLNKK